MNRVFTKTLLFLTLIFACDIAVAQQLELDGGKDDTSVSTKVNSAGVASSRVIIYTNIKINYDTNMESIPVENIKSGTANGMMVDTLYFFMGAANGTTRRIYLDADGFARASITVNLTPKATYKYTVIDPSNGGTEYSQLLDSANKASSEHKYDIALGFYRQALTAESAPADLSAVRGYITVMETCDKHLTYAKKCLIAAKKLRDANSQGADSETVKKINGYYEEALKSYEGIKGYMNDDKYDSMISKIKSAISELSKLPVKTTTSTSYATKTVKTMAAAAYAGVVEDAANTANKLGGVKIYGMTSSNDKKPTLLATTDGSGKFEIKLSANQKDLYKILLFDPKNIKGYKKTKQVNISTGDNYAKLRVKLFK
ncbi:MAG: hypothetical protein SNJ29_10815 [Rikenellaceae bacterium]